MTVCLKVNGDLRNRCEEIWFHKSTEYSPNIVKSVLYTFKYRDVCYDRKIVVRTKEALGKALKNITNSSNQEEIIYIYGVTDSPILPNQLRGLHGMIQEFMEKANLRDMSMEKHHANLFFYKRIIQDEVNPLGVILTLDENGEIQKEGKCLQVMSFSEASHAKLAMEELLKTYA